MKTLIIIPAYNESMEIEKVVNEIMFKCPKYDYIIINDGSDDDTKKICNSGKYNVLNLPINLGIGGAVQTGYKYAREKEYDFAVQFDGDGQHEASYIDDLLEPLLTNEAEITIGSRFIKKEGFQSSFIRRIGIVFLSLLIRICTGKKFSDVTSGFRAVNKRYIKIFSYDYSRDYPEPEAIITGIMYGARIKEIPVIMKQRESGSSSIRRGKSLYYMIKVTLAIIIRRISYGVRR